MKKFPTVDYSLCNKKVKNIIGGQICKYYSFFKSYGLCAFDNSECLPSKQYQKEFEIMKNKD